MLVPSHAQIISDTKAVRCAHKATTWKWLTSAARHIAAWHCATLFNEGPNKQPQSNIRLTHNLDEEGMHERVLLEPVEAAGLREVAGTHLALE